jgi:perosamine synthetase
MEITAPYFDESEIEMVARCLNSGWVTQGPFVAEFEQLFAQQHDVENAIATTSCTAALHLGNLALGLGVGDEVIVPAFTWVTSAYSVEYVGATPVFADIDLETFNLSYEAAEAAITDRTRAIMAVHLFGLPCDIDPLRSLARKHRLALIEDAACAVGTRYKGVPVGGLGDVGSFSFHPRKVITTGEGGMVTTNNARLSETVKSLRNHGATGLPQGSDPADPSVMSTFNRLGFNLRLSDIQAAIGIAQMAKLEGLLTHRRNMAAHYNHVLEHFDEVVLPVEPEYGQHSYQSYVIRLHSHDAESRNSIMRNLARREIRTRPGTHAVPYLGYYQERDQRGCDWRNAKIAEDTTITLPIFPSMTFDDVALVAHELGEALRE